MQIYLERTGVIRVGMEIYAPWPNFRIIEAPRVYGRWNYQHLHKLLVEDDLFFAAWRQEIPPSILSFLGQVPEGHAGLLILAQINPARFSCLLETHPALLLLQASIFEQHDLFTCSHIDLERLAQLHLSQILERSGISRKQLFRLLKKVPLADCWFFHLEHLMELTSCCQQGRLLRHLPVLNRSVSWLLRMHPPMLDSSLLTLAAKQPQYDDLSITDIVSSMMTKREFAGREPAWPYVGVIKTWPQLLRAERKNAICCQELSEQLPPPPLPAYKAKGRCEITPLITRQQVIAEAEAMGNCLRQYLDDIHVGDRYAYQMKGPERATILLKRVGEQWQVETIGLRKNQRKASPTTVALVRRWMDTATEKREGQI